MIAVIDTNHLLRIAAAYQRSPLFAARRIERFESSRNLSIDHPVWRGYNCRQAVKHTR